MSRRHALQKF
jgi:hypothetical protein